VRSLSAARRGGGRAHLHVLDLPRAQPDVLVVVHRPFCVEQLVQPRVQRGQSPEETVLFTVLLDVNLRRTRLLALEGRP
jgi:hypothetical protein